MAALAYKRYGQSGPVLIILHGLFGNSKNWHRIAASLADHYSVYCLDLRNHGRSFHHVSMDYIEMKDDVLAFMNGHQIDSANFIGHSMGGKVLMALALLLPQKINKMILVDIAPVNYENHFNELISAIQNLPLPIIKNRTEADNYLARQIESQSIRQFLLMNLRRINGSYKWLFSISAIAENIDKIIGFPKILSNYSYHEQCLFISGVYSDYINQENEKKIKQLFPKYTLLKVKNAGHWIHAEQPEIFLNIIKTYIKPDD